MSAFLRLLALALLAAALASPGLAQEPDLVRVDLVVTAVSGGGVYVDQGRAAGLEPGDLVRFLPASGSSVEGTVRSVSRTSARVELADRSVVLDVGTIGEALVPRARLVPPEPVREDEPAPTQEPPDPRELDRPLPEHPPWEHPPVEWQADLPLLAPVFERRPEEREMRVTGRVFAQLDYARDDEGGSSSSLLARTGADLRFDNPFGRAGTARVDGDLFHRTVDLDDEPGETDQRFRLDRLSYGQELGIDRDRRWEAGRFLQSIPELGVLDGVEVGRRFGSGRKPTDELRTGDDLQAALYYRRELGDRHRMSWTTAYQKTWHRGHPDRDLFVANADYRSPGGLTLYGSAWVDYYTSGDEAKSPGLELTRLLFNGDHRWESGHSIGVFASHYRIPDIERNEFVVPSPDQVADARSDRVGLRGTRRVSDDLRLDGRVGYWSDQDDAGADTSIGFRLRDRLYEGGEVGLTLYANQGKFTDTLGLRASATKDLESGSLRLSWDAIDVDAEAGESLLHHVVRASLDRALGERWSVSLFVEGQLGDQQDGQVVGVFVQRRIQQ